MEEKRKVNSNTVLRGSLLEYLTNMREDHKRTIAPHNKSLLSNHLKDQINQKVQELQGESMTAKTWRQRQKMDTLSYLKEEQRKRKLKREAEMLNKEVNIC